MIGGLPGGFLIEARGACPSTMDEVRRLAQAGAPGGTVVIAESQTAGRGRRGRIWSSAPGNLYCSILLRPTCDAREAPLLGFAAGVALADAAAEVVPTGATVELKWPNDLLLAGAKAAGLLLEAGPLEAGRPGWIVLGIGVNVTAEPENQPQATSLRRHGANSSAPEFLAILLRHLASWLGRFESEGFAPVRLAWLARARGLGGELSVRLETETLAGRFADLDAGGALVLDLPGGRRKLVHAGDVLLAA
jgi:BirA family transcriptional regulator, biotin operon repressor / biotin---[acetyl-CoA-carboxylase] ligase